VARAGGFRKGGHARRRHLPNGFDAVGALQIRPTAPFPEAAAGRVPAKGGPTEKVPRSQA